MKNNLQGKKMFRAKLKLTWWSPTYKYSLSTVNNQLPNFKPEF